MVSIDTHPLHNISWVDLASKDVDAAIEFYSGLFGWTTFNDGETPYSIFMAGDKPVGGIMGMTPEMGEMPAVWSTYVNVEDADAIIAAATAAGGSVYQPPFDIPGGGRIAVIGDPDGAALCLFEGNADNGLKALDEVGAPCWWDCMTRDAAGAKAFYTTVFGWGIEEIPEMNYTIFTNHGEYLCGTMAMPDDVPKLCPLTGRSTLSLPTATPRLSTSPATAGRSTTPRWTHHLAGPARSWTHGVRPSTSSIDRRLPRADPPRLR